MDVTNLTVEKFKAFVGNKFFTAVFIKKDGTERTLTGRLAVRKYVKGTQPEATAKRKETLTDQNMIGVFEVNNDIAEDGHVKSGEEKYRTLNLNTIKRLSANGEVLYSREFSAKEIANWFNS